MNLKQIRSLGYLMLSGCMMCALACDGSQSSVPKSTVVILGEAGVTDGKFYSPRAVETDATGNLYVIDKTGRVQIFNPDFSFKRTFRLPEYEQGTPTGFCITKDGRIFIADTHYSRVLVYNLEGKLLHSFGEYGEQQGKMIYPTDVAVDDAGTIYVAEYGKQDRILKFSKDFAFLEQWGGTGTEEGLFNRPMALAIADNERLLVCDSCNHRVQIFDLHGNFIQAFGKVGQALHELKYPYDVAVDDDGTIYVCEYGNCRVQLFSPDGVMMAFKGKAGRCVGELNAPWGVTLCGDRMMVADAGNNRIAIFSKY